LEILCEGGEIKIFVLLVNVNANKQYAWSGTNCFDVSYLAIIPTLLTAGTYRISENT
jgi:hypothetical protein